MSNLKKRRGEQRELKAALAGNPQLVQQHQLQHPVLLKAYLAFLKDNFTKSHNILAAMPVGPNRALVWHFFFYIILASVLVAPPQPALGRACLFYRVIYVVMCDVLCLRPMLLSMPPCSRTCCRQQRANSKPLHGLNPNRSTPSPKP